MRTYIFDIGICLPMDRINISFELMKNGNMWLKKEGYFKYVFYDILVIEYDNSNYLVFAVCNYNLRIENDICILNNKDFRLELSFETPSYLKIFADVFDMLKKNTYADYLYLCKCFKNINICSNSCNNGQNENIFTINGVESASFYNGCVRDCKRCILKRNVISSDMSVHDIISNEIVVSSSYDLVYKDIRNMLENKEKNIFLCLLIQSLLEVTDFITYSVKDDKRTIIKQLWNLGNYGIFLYLIKNHAELFLNMDWNDEKSVEEVINLYIDEETKLIRFKECYNFFLNSDFLNYMLITKDYAFFLNSLEEKTANNEEYDLCLYKDVLNTAPFDYEKMFYYFCCISKKTLISFLDLNKFFRNFEIALEKDSTDIWYINEGLYILFHNLSKIRVNGFTSMNIDLLDPSIESFKESLLFIEKSDFINEFFILFHKIANEDYVTPNFLRLILLLTNIFGYRMRELFLNSELLKIITFKKYQKKIEILYLFKIFTSLVSYNAHFLDNFLISNGLLERIIKLSIENRGTGIEDLFNNIYKRCSPNIKKFINLQLK